MEMLSNILYVTIVNQYELLDGVVMKERQQYIFKGFIDIVAEYKGSNNIIEQHYIGELCEKDWYEENGITIKEIYIPERFAVLTHECISEDKINILEYIAKRDSDTTTDYFIKTKKAFGINMKNNYKIQRNCNKYDEDLFPINRIKNTNYKNDE
jgi:hypothetical protein